MKQKFIKIIAAAVAVIFSAVLPVRADIIDPYFGGTVYRMTPFSQSGRISDGSFAMNIVQAAVTKNRALVVFSLRALTPSAKEMLPNLDPFNYGVEFDIEGESFPVSFERHTELDTADTRYFSVYAGSISNRYLAPVVFSLGMINLPREQKLVRITASDAGTINIPFWKLPGGGSIVIDPIGVNVTKKLSGSGRDMLINTGIFFRMIDGKIKTFNQLFSPNRTAVLVDRDKNMYEISAMSREVLDLNSFRSVIYNGIEYGILSSTAKEISLSDNFLRVYFDYYDCPSGETDVDPESIFTELGAMVKWDDSHTRLTVEYNGIRATLTSGMDLVEVGDGTVQMSHPAHMENGRLMVDADFIDSVIPLQTTALDWNVPIGERKFVIYP